MHCPGGNATDLIWRVLASSLGISFWTPLNLNRVTLTLTLWPINSGVLTSLLLLHLSSSLTDFLKFTSCDNQALVGCIPIAAVGVHLNLKSSKLVSDCVRCIAIRTEFWRVYDNLKCLYKKSGNLLNVPRNTNKTCKILLEKQGRTHKLFSSIDPHIWMCQCWFTCKNLSSTAVHGRRE